MPKKEQTTEEPTEVKKTPVEEKLFPFGVFINGQDRTIFAKDEADLQVRLSKLRSPHS